MDIEMECPEDCPAYCCRRFRVRAPGPGTELDKLAQQKLGHWVAKTTGVSLTMLGDCINLDENSRCRIYEDRPRFCQDFYCWNTDVFKESVEVYKKNLARIEEQRVTNPLLPSSSG